MPALRQSGKGPRAQSGARPGEDGYILIAVLFLVALVLIGLAVAAPRMAKSIQRDKEIEAVHRGEQYKRAIQLYYRKFGRYPSSIDQLVDTNNIRFLRKKYTDPITGKDDWRLIHPGQAKVPPMGFFGQPLAGVPGTANLGAHVSGATGASAGTSAFGGSSGSSFGSSMGSSTFGSSMGSSTSSGGIDVETPALGISTPESGNPGTSAGSGSTGASPTSGASSSPFGTTDSSKPFGSTDAGSASPMGIGQIIGVGLPSTKASLLDYKKQDHYNKWEFVYFPIEDQMKAMGAMGAGGGNVNGNDGTKSNSPFGNNGSSFGNSNSPFGNSGSSSFGNSGSSFGSSGSSFSAAPSGGTAPPNTSNPQR
jgi:type II secretory pathway pseudopilin PulG